MEHKKIDLGNIHKPHNWEFADATARLAAVISDSDMIGALALQLNTGSYWRLSATSPTTAWELAATGNQTDAYLLDRANHTGSQAISTVTGLQTALDGKIAFTSVLTGLSLAVGGALLSTDTVLEALGKLGHHVADTNNPHGVTKAQVGLGSVENKSSATIRGEISSLNVTGALGFTPADAAIIGQANGIAPLDSTGKLASSYLPGYVDDVIEGANLAAFPATGESGKMYVALDSGKVYRWSGSTYIEISGSPGSTDAVPEGSVNLYWTNARTIGSVLTGLSTGTSGALASTDTVLQALGKLEATKITSSVGSLTPAGGTLFVTGSLHASGRITAVHASADDNNVIFENSHANSYGLYSRGGSDSRYAAQFNDKDGNQLLLLSGVGALTVAGGGVYGGNLSVTGIGLFGDDTAHLRFGKLDSNAVYLQGKNAAGDAAKAIVFYGLAEYGRFDTSGNLLIGKSGYAYTGRGVYINPNDGASGRVGVASNGTGDGYAYIITNESTGALIYSVKGNGDITTSGNLLIGKSEYAYTGRGVYIAPNDGASGRIGVASNGTGDGYAYIITNESTGALIYSVKGNGDITTSGVLNYGTYTGTPGSITGYIEIKDSGGTVRKLAVIS